LISLTTSDPIILVGLYLDPPDRALVLCCDEKTKEAVAMNEGFRRQVLDLLSASPRRRLCRLSRLNSTFTTSISKVLSDEGLPRRPNGPG
jgi:hypothetical protein